MSRRVRSIAAVLLAAMVWMGLSGCLEHPFHHSRREVTAYLEKNFPGEDITVSRSYTETADEKYDRTVRTWDCWFTDLPDAVFQVSSAWWDGGPVPVAGYGLGNNARRTLWSYYLEQYLQEAGSLDAWAIESNELLLSYSSMDQVYPAQEQLQAFYGWLMEQPHVQDPLSATVRLTGLPLPAGNLDTREYIRPEETSWASACGDMAEVCAEMLRTYYAFYGLPCPGFSPEEQADFALKRWIWTPGTYPYPLACSRDGESVPLSAFTGIGLEGRYISYAGLYEMLSRLDLAPEGSLEEFSFTGADGALYQFSYANVLHREGQTDWLYYWKDGQPVQCSSNGAPRLYLGDEALETITGLHFTFD